MWCFLLVVACLLAAASLEECYYAQLGVSRQATQQEVRQAYKRLAIKLHPDKNPDESLKEKFIKISEAYETLKDPERRRRYNLYGANPTYERRYDSRSHAEYNKLYHQGLYHDDENIVNLSGKDYDSFFTEEFHFINFYSPFCPPCQALSDDWKQLALLYKGIVRVGAVNCKLHSSFCHNSMRISSYPTLLFYPPPLPPPGTPGRWVRYTGARTLHALSQHVLQHLRARTAPPAASPAPAPAAALPALALRASRWDEAAALRIMYHLDGIASVHRSEWSCDDDVTAELRASADVTARLRATHESALLARVAAALPAPAAIVDAATLREMRESLRSGARSEPVLLYFTGEGDSVLPLHQEKKRHGEEFSFGWVDCSVWSQLCASLGVLRAPAWGALKPGGAWQLRIGAGRLRGGWLATVRARRLHSLAPHEAERLLAGEDADAWLIAVLPAGTSESRAARLADAVSACAARLAADARAHFAVVRCAHATGAGAACSRAAPLIALQRGRERLVHAGEAGAEDLVRFVRLALDSRVIDLDERTLASVLDPESRTIAWLVAFLPARCVSCALIELEWRVAAEQLAIDNLSIATLDCARRDVPLCANVRLPTIRLLLPGDGAAFNGNLETLARAPYIVEWALSRLVPARALTADTFDQALRSEGSPWLVYFHSPRCQHCYERYAAFALAGRRLAGGARLARVDCLAERGLCRRERVAAYPTLRVYTRRGARAVELSEPERVADEVRAHVADEVRARDEL